MTVHGTGASAVNPPEDTSHSEIGLSESRALVPLAQAKAANRRIRHFRHPPAVFLAQLIATTQDAPQTRQRRRATPEAAARAYAATAAISNG